MLFFELTEVYGEDGLSKLLLDFNGLLMLLKNFPSESKIQQFYFFKKKLYRPELLYLVSDDERFGRKSFDEYTKLSKHYK